MSEIKFTDDKEHKGRLLNLLSWLVAITTHKLGSYLCSGTCVREMTIFWSMKMSNARRKPRPTALSVFIPVSLSNGGNLKIGPSWTLNTGTVKSIRYLNNIKQI